jgi:hypothetical protein
MRQEPTDIVQSFRLRFWREPHPGTSDYWRGTVWWEQQRPDEKAAAVNSPEDAFKFVRSMLHAHAGIEAETRDPLRGAANEFFAAALRNPIRPGLRLPFRLWRKLRKRTRDR